jgi:ABC-type nitrate/sulfonate/bicarbonate transport system substrate-binding protein
MKRRFLAFAGVLLLAGCGGSAAAPTAAPSTPAPAASSPVSASKPAAESAAAKPAASASAAAKPSASDSAAAKPAASGSAAASVAPAGSGTLLIPYSQPAAAFAPGWIAQDQGLFKKYGLNTEVRNIQPPTDVQTVVNGESPIGIDGSLGINAIASGAPITFIAVPGPIFTQSIFAQPSINSLQDLVGKAVGVTSRGGSSDNALHTVLAKSNIDASKLNIVYLRDDSAILAALQGGSVQAAILTSPNTLRAKQVGLKELVYTPDMQLRTVNNGIIANKTYAKDHPEVIENFLKGFMEGLKVAKTDPAATKAAIGKWAKIEDQSLLDESYKTVVGMWNVYPLSTDASFQNVMDLSSEQNVKSHKPSDFYDNSYLEKLQDFVKTLYPNGMPS